MQSENSSPCSEQPPKEGYNCTPYRVPVHGTRQRMSRRMHMSSTISLLCSVAWQNGFWRNRTWLKWRTIGIHGTPLCRLITSRIPQKAGSFLDTGTCCVQIVHKRPYYKCIMYATCPANLLFRHLFDPTMWVNFCPEDIKEQSHHKRDFQTLIMLPISQNKL